MRTTNCSTSSETRGLPNGRRRWLPSNFWAISRLYQRMRVSGVARVATAFETFAAEGVGQHGETAAFGVGQAQPAPAELGFEEAVFRRGDT